MLLTDYALPNFTLLRAENLPRFQLTLGDVELAKKVYRYSVEFKFTVVKLSGRPGIRR